jgi:hypothetical protein
MLSLRLGYPPPDLDGTEENETGVSKGNTRKKGNAPPAQKDKKAIRAEGEDSSDIEAGSDSSESSDSDKSHQVDETSGDVEPSSSDEEVESQSAAELVSALEKKVPSARKPSKKAIETALNEVS